MRSKKYRKWDREQQKKAKQEARYEKEAPKKQEAAPVSRAAAEPVHKTEAGQKGVPEAAQAAAANAAAVPVKKKRRWPKVLAVILVILIAGGAGAYAYLQHYLNSKLNQVKRVKVDKNKLGIVDVKGYVNIALLGVDSRSMDKKNLKDSNTDAIIIVSMNTKTKKVNLISVYRDTYLQINGTSTYDKVNSAFSTSGINGSLNTLNQAMDLDIDSYVLFNFKMVSDLVNQVGGITVTVHQNEIQQLNKYTAQTAKNIGQKHYKLVKKPGKQKLEGVQAVSYGRIRKGVGDDFKRTSRMRTVIRKVMAKLKHCSLSQLSNIMDVCLKQCQTNLSNNDMIGLAQRLSGLEIDKSIGWPYNVTTGYLGEVSYVFPVDLEQNAKKLHREMFGQKDYKPSAKLKNESDEIKKAVASGSSMYSVNTQNSTYKPYQGSSASGSSAGRTYSGYRSGSGAASAGRGTRSAGNAAGRSGAAASGNAASGNAAGGNASGAAGTASGSGENAAAGEAEE